LENRILGTLLIRLFASVSSLDKLNYIYYFTPLDRTIQGCKVIDVIKFYCMISSRVVRLEFLLILPAFASVSSLDKLNYIYYFTLLDPTIQGCKVIDVIEFYCMISSLAVRIEFL